MWIWVTYFEINISSRYTYPIVDLASYLNSQTILFLLSFWILFSMSCTEVFKENNICPTMNTWFVIFKIFT